LRTVYVAVRRGAGEFLWRAGRTVDIIVAFEEQYFIDEEVYLSLALRELGRFQVLREPIVASGRKLRMYSARHVLGRSLSIIIRGPRAARSRAKLDFWYNGRRENRLS